MPKIYRVAGVTATEQRFSLEVTAEKPHDAIEKVYASIGSRHKLSRVQIKIREIKAISTEEARREEVKSILMVDKLVKY